MHLRLSRFWPLLPAALLATVMASGASAATQGPVPIAVLGTQWNTGYVSFTAPLVDTCQFNNVYINLTTDGGRAALSVLLTAHASGRPISRIDYSKDSQGMCWLELVQL